MCLAVPMRLESVAESRGVAAVEGVRRTVRLDLVPQARTGEWVLVHAGFAIQVMDEAAAQETLDLLRELEAAGESAAAEEGPAAPAGVAEQRRPIAVADPERDRDPAA